MIITEFTSYNPELKEIINKFLSQLVGTEYLISKDQLEAIILDQNSHLFFAINAHGDYLGMITVGTYIAPTGKKVWIEDVVVDEKFRGEGAGKALTNFAVQFARDQQADVVMLTSKPERINANILYKKVGFQLRETNVYRMLLK